MSLHRPGKARGDCGLAEQLADSWHAAFVPGLHSGSSGSTLHWGAQLSRAAAALRSGCYWSCGSVCDDHLIAQLQAGSAASIARPISLTACKQVVHASGRP